MPRPRNIEPSVRLSCWLPEGIHARLMLAAYSPLHGKIPPRGLTEVVSAALQQYFARVDAADPTVVTNPEVLNVQS